MEFSKLTCNSQSYTEYSEILFLIKGTLMQIWKSPYMFVLK